MSFCRSLDKIRNWSASLNWLAFVFLFQYWRRINKWWFHWMFTKLSCKSNASVLLWNQLQCNCSIVSSFTESECPFCPRWTDGEGGEGGEGGLRCETAKCYLSGHKRDCVWMDVAKRITHRYISLSQAPVVQCVIFLNVAPSHCKITYSSTGRSLFLWRLESWRWLRSVVDWNLVAWNTQHYCWASFLKCRCACKCRHQLQWV